MKRTLRRTTAALLALLLLLLAGGCVPQTQENPEEGNAQAGATPEPTLAPETALAADDMFTDRDMETDYHDEDSVEITLSDAGVAVDSPAVRAEGGIVTITDEGTYVLTGSLSDGQIAVDAGDGDKIWLVLSGASVTCSDSAALYVKQADKVFVTLAEGSQNALATTGEFAAIDDSNIDGAVFSKADLTFNGTGALSVSAVYGHGIVGKDDLVFTGGSYDIAGAGHGIQGKDSVRIAGGSYTIASGKDGVHAENADDAALGFLYVAGGTFQITAGTDGLDAAASLQIEGGDFTITTGGGSQNASTDAGGNQMPGWGDWGGGQMPDRGTGGGFAPGASQTAAETGETETASAKGLKAAGDLLINAGNFIIDSSDDSLHSNANVYVSGGAFTLTSGDDGIHADTRAVVSGGTLAITKSYEGIEGQSIDIAGGTITITAGDDGLNAAGGNDGSGLGGRPGAGSFTADAASYISISGGSITIDAGGDGVDSNGSLYVSGGETYVSGPTNSANGALDYMSTAEVTGGVFVAAGPTGMAQNFGAGSTQGAMLCSTGAQAGGTPVTLKDAAGAVLVSYTPAKAYETVVISAPGIVAGGSYTLEAGGQTQPISMTSLIYGTGGGMGGMDGGRNQGGRR